MMQRYDYFLRKASIYGKNEVLIFNCSITLAPHFSTYHTIHQAFNKNTHHHSTNLIF